MGQAPSTPNQPTSTSPEQRDAVNMTGLDHQSATPQGPEEQAPPYEIVLNPADWPAWDGEKDQDIGTLPQNPFVFSGAIPADIRPKNVVLFGETGAGKSSVINLLAGAEVAKTSANSEGCTLQATEYLFTLPGATSFRIYDTVGLNEPEMGVNSFFDAIKKAQQLITSLHNTGGVDLLLFCIRGGRVTNTMQQNYRLFSEVLCAKKTPLAFVVTHLEHEDAMEDWWGRNRMTLEETYEMHSVAHACVTALPVRVMGFAKKRAESRRVLKTMLENAWTNPNAPYVTDVGSWFTSVIRMLWSFFRKCLGLEKRALLNTLETRCGFTPEDARRLADMLAAERG